MLRWTVGLDAAAAPLLACLMFGAGAFTAPVCAEADESAFNDSLRVNEFMLRCADAREQFIELVASGDGQFFSSDTRLAAYDHNDNLLYDLHDVVQPFRDGTTWEKGRTLLLGTYAFRFAAGTYLDAELPGYLDLEGGRLRLYQIDPSTLLEETIQDVAYGPASPNPAPPMGNSLALDASGAYALNPAPTPTRLDGTLLHADCDRCYYPRNPVCPVSEWYVLGGPWQPVDAASFTYDFNGSHLSFDLAQGTAYMYASDFWETRLELHDTYRLEGPGEPDTIAFKVRLTADIRGGERCTSHGHCDYAYPSVSLQHDGQVVANPEYSLGTQVLEIDLKQVKCEEFEIVQAMSVVSDGLILGGVGWVNSHIDFAGLPQGYSVTSCRGYVTDVPTPVLISNAGTEAVPGVVALRWQTSESWLDANVYRRESAETSDWLRLGVVAPDGVGMLTFEDRDVAPGASYDYRLGVEEAGVERFFGLVSVDVPAAPVLAIRFPNGHPLRPGAAIELSLPAAGAGVLRVYDVAGRRVGSMNVRSDGVRAVRVWMSEVAGLEPGLYMVELRQGAERVARRVVVVR